MKQVLIRGGTVVVDDVPAPQVGKRSVLVQVEYSCISPGTELAGVAVSGMPLYRRALKQPENAKRVLGMVRDQGIKRTWARVRRKLTAGSPTGYSAAGRVVDIGTAVHGFAVGDRVACAGARIANHAEIINVPVNLVAHIPSRVASQDAATVTLGAIALQGVRRAAPSLGETVVVVGLGVLGQITVQLLRANGCRVIGVEPDPHRLELARKNGMVHGINPDAPGYLEKVARTTGGHGADAAIVTAATSSSEVISEAFQACRRKARVVLVGDVGLNLRRSDLYSKELDLLISTSYGPGRYDPFYEEEGHDYPLPYVRWTENRNMSAYLALLAAGDIRLDSLMGVDPYPVERAADAYAALADPECDALAALIQYRSVVACDHKVQLRTVQTGATNKIRVGLAGAGSFAQGVHLPNLLKLREDFLLHAVMSRTGSNAKAVATQYEAEYATTDYTALLADERVDLIMIATRHNLHGDMVLRALRAGKHVFVEKPLALRIGDLDAITDFYRANDTPDAPLLMTGFNRRFSPAARVVKAALSERSTPIVVNYRMNAGFISPEHWVQREEGGGRNLGEACHIYDLFRFFTGAAITGVSARSAHPKSGPWKRNDNFVASISYADGSLCSLTYCALGSARSMKERMEVFVDGEVIELDDYRNVRFAGRTSANWSARSPEKGQLEELRALALAIRRGSEWPISLEEQLETSRLACRIEHQIHGSVADQDQTSV